MDKVELLLPEKLRPLYNHPAGPRTVFFWAPIMKWGLVCAGLADMARPAEKLSTAQSTVLMATDINKNSNLKESSKRVPDHLNILDVDRNIET